MSDSRYGCANVQCANVPCAMYQCTVYNVQCANLIHSVPCAMWNVPILFTMCQCTMYRVPHFWHICFTHFVVNWHLKNHMFHVQHTYTTQIRSIYNRKTKISAYFGTKYTLLVEILIFPLPERQTPRSVEKILVNFLKWLLEIVNCCCLLVCTCAMCQFFFTCAMCNVPCTMCQFFFTCAMCCVPCAISVLNVPCTVYQNQWHIHTLVRLTLWYICQLISYSGRTLNPWRPRDM